MENLFRIELNFSGIFIAVVVIWLFYNQIKQKNKENKIFLRLCYITVMELLLDSIFWLVDTRQFFLARQMNILVNTLYYFFQILLCYVWMGYCDAQLEIEDRKWKRILMGLPFLLGVALLITNVWTGSVFTVDNYNIYSRSWGLWGGLEAVLCFFYPCYSILLVLMKMLMGDRERRRNGIYLLLVSLVPIVSAIFQMLFYGLNFIWIGMALALLLVLIEIEVRQYHQMENELTEQRISIMLSQIQPHFLYNSLTAISYLCDENPKKAKEATIAFSRYLRGNLDSIKQKQPLLFETELKHIQIYLSLEKMRFEDELKVIYHIQIQDFLIPALSVQPLVENAVKYGVGQKEDGGTVIISTREEKDEIVITVEDDGIGFEPSEIQYDGRSHIGIDNVRNRLKTMVNGTLTIESTKGAGTVATVKIPRKL